MPPRDVEDGKCRLYFPRHDQRTFRLLPQTAGVPHPARPCPFQSPKRALVAAPQASVWTCVAAFRYGFHPCRPVPSLRSTLRAASPDRSKKFRPMRAGPSANLPR